MKRELEQAIAAVCRELFGVDVNIELTRPDEQFGDYATSVALQLSKQLGKNPREVAEAIAAKLQTRQIDQTPPDASGVMSNELNKPIIKAAHVAGPGFINIQLSDAALWELIEARPSQDLAGKTVVVEYSDPNPFKVLHAGHLYTSVVGDAIANLFELTGAQVHRVNFGGDVGLHVAKTMWAILQKLGGENPDKLQVIDPEDRPDWLSEVYVAGNTAYNENETAKAEIVALNKRVYQLHTDADHSSSFAHIYWTTREWSYTYFDSFYTRLGTKFEKYYPESETAPLGLTTVREHVPAVYQESDGAIVFKGEPYGLHTRVFINSEGLPTYEAKDVGLSMTKWQDYHFDQSIIITGNDIAEYMKVVLKSIEQFAPELSDVTTHLTHGIVKLTGGQKMSSRKGNILRANDVLDAASQANQKLTGKDDEQVVLAAVKYAFLKQRIGGDIMYDPEESVSLQGNSGPYLQYAHARARSILRKKPVEDVKWTSFGELQPDERGLLRKMGEFSEVRDKAITECMPHYIATYLYELAQQFNSFYEHNTVLDDPREGTRLHLVNMYTILLKAGLSILGINAPEKM